MKLEDLKCTDYGEYKVYENDECKLVRSKDYNYNFNKINGKFMRWGKTLNDDPEMAPSCEIADIEISQGYCKNSCPWCYKGNCKSKELHNMTLEEFKNVFHKINQSGILTQIAFGVTSPSDNPDFFDMIKYARKNGVISNYTCHGSDMTPELAKLTAENCGAIALSVSSKDETYNAVKMLTEAGMKQINFHMVAYNGSYDKILSVIDDIKTDERLKGVKALVMLKYKDKGTNSGTGKFTCLSQEQYNYIFEYAEKNGIALGFDSCSCYTYLNAIKDRKNYKSLAMYAEPCESTLFSIYVNSYSEVAPCSFCELENKNGNNWIKGINLLEIQDFDKEVWNSDRIKEFRRNLLNNHRKCPMYNLD